MKSAGCAMRGSSGGTGHIKSPRRATRAPSGSTGPIKQLCRATRAPSVSTGAIIFPEDGVRNQLYRKDVQYQQRGQGEV